MEVCRVACLNRVRLAVLALLVASTSAQASFGAHYLGTSRDHTQFRLYLDGGAFLGRTGAFQAIRVTTHQVRPGQPLRAMEGCVYRFDDTNRRRDRIDCAEDAPHPLRGVAYARDPAQTGKGAGGPDRLVCVRRCGGTVPQRLSLEAEEDNH